MDFRVKPRWTCLERQSVSFSMYCHSIPVDDTSNRRMSTIEPHIGSSLELALGLTGQMAQRNWVSSGNDEN